MTIRAGASRRFAPKTGGTVIGAVLHGLLNREQFASLADAADALKCQCARLRLPYTGPQIDAAIRSVAWTRPVCQDARPVRRLHPVTIARGLTHREAVAALQRLGGPSW